MKDRNHEYKLQEKELERLRADKERDQRELERLRAMLGMIRKQDYGVQVNMNMQSASGSWTTKFENSTEIEVGSDGHSPKRTRSPQLVDALLSRISKTAKANKYNQTVQGPFQNEHKFSKNTNHETILSPSQTHKACNNFYRVPSVVENESKSNKLSNSPYSKLRYTRKTSRYHPN